VIQAAEAEVGVFYRRTVDPGRSYYERMPEARVSALWKKLRTLDPRLLQPAQLRTLQVLARVTAGQAVAFKRYIRGTDPMSGERYELEEIVAIPLDYHLRPVQAPPSYK
jgi:hypothetical protein